MKTILILFIAIFAISASAKSYNEDDEAILKCELNDGSKLIALPWMVIIDDEILAKVDPVHKVTKSSDQYVYLDHGYKVTVYKQFCGRERYQGVILKRLKSGKVQFLSCKNRVKCNLK